MERKRQKEEREAEKQRIRQIKEVNRVRGDKIELCRELTLDVSNLLNKTIIDIGSFSGARSPD